MWLGWSEGLHLLRPPDSVLSKNDASLDLLCGFGKEKSSILLEVVNEGPLATAVQWEQTARDPSAWVKKSLSSKQSEIMSLQHTRASCVFCGVVGEGGSQDAWVLFVASAPCVFWDLSWNSGDSVSPFHGWGNNMVLSCGRL